MVTEVSQRVYVILEIQEADSFRMGAEDTLVRVVDVYGNLMDASNAMEKMRPRLSGWKHTSFKVIEQRVK